MVASVLSSLSDALSDNLELTTPFTAVHSVREGAYLLRRGLSPYASPVCRHPILLLRLIDAADRSDVLCTLLLAVHVLTAGAVVRLACATRPHAHSRISPRLLGAAYLLSPWNLAACVARSSVGVTHVLITMALLTAHAGAAAPAGAALAAAAYAAPDTAWLLPATALLCASRRGARCARGARARLRALAAVGGWWAAWLVALLLASRASLGSWGWLAGVYKAWLVCADARPNVGAWWYLLAEAFPAQRAALVAALHLLPRLCLLPLALRLRTAPLLAGCLSAALVLAFAPYPSAPDACFGLALLAAPLSADPSLRAHAVGAPPALALALAALGCLPGLRANWLDRRTLNANFLYAATLLLAACQAWLVFDVASAALARDARAAAARAAARVQRAWRRRSRPGAEPWRQ